MIVLDIETSGLSGINGIWQIGTLELENPNNFFLEECRIDDEDIIDEIALKLTGKTESDLRNTTLQSQKNLIRNYFNFVEGIKDRIIIGQNIGWDITMIQYKAIKYDLHDEFLRVVNQRTMDLHTLAQERHWDWHGKYLKDENGRDIMNLSRTLEMCGIKDDRMNTVGKKITKEGRTHNALEDCRLEGEVYSRIKFGKNLFPEYSQYEIPQYLRRKIA